MVNDEPRCFSLERAKDPTGVSGTGRVAWGVVFITGKVVVNWCVPNKPQSVTVYDDLDEVERVHGHDGLTRVVFMDDPDIGYPVGPARPLPRQRHAVTVL